MTLIRVRNQQVIPIPRLIRVVVRYVYEKDKMRLDEIHAMQDSIVGWANKVDLSEEERFLVIRMGDMLKKDEMGEFDNRKKLFKEHGIDWKKFHGFHDTQCG